MHINIRAGWYTEENCPVAFDIFIHFPLFLEPFGLAVAEAMKAGIFVIGPKEGGISQFLKDKITGYTFDSLSINAKEQLMEKMNAAFRLLIDKDTSFDKIRLNGKKEIDQNYSNEIMVKNLEYIYEGLI